ncbi:MAG: hypothetical protein PSV13_12220 [Lacunisphaera sp.]|nr:hypothetical protein [Lacunisphaera sp.]
MFLLDREGGPFSRRTGRPDFHPCGEKRAVAQELELATKAGDLATARAGLAGLIAQFETLKETITKTQ